jgi:hypothetical protein
MCGNVKELAPFATSTLALSMPFRDASTIVPFQHQMEQIILAIEPPIIDM